MKNIDSFISDIKRVSDSRIHKVTKSLGVYDAYKWIRKNKWLDIGRPVTEHEFYSIIRSVNNILADELSKGNDVNLPNRMGRLEVRKYRKSIKIENGKVITNLPIDWNRTLKLWYHDNDAKLNKDLVRVESDEIFKICYNRSKAEYTNKSFYKFNVNRNIKIKLKQNIQDGIVDAFNIN